MMNSLKGQAINGVKWNIIDNLANSGITFLVGIILARLLSPTEFGIIGLITVFIAVSNVIVEGGFSTALIRKLDATSEDNSTVFTTNLIFSIILSLVLVLIAAPVAKFFNEPVISRILPTMSLLIIFNALSIIQRTNLIKQLNFKLQAKISLIASLGSGFLGIGFALIDFGVWSLVIQQISRQFFLMLFFWIYNPWKPSIKISKQSFHELFGFGSKILLSNLLNTIYKNVFISAIGKLYTSTQLGFYTRADQFNTIMTNNLSIVIQKVSYPTFCKIKDEKERLKQVFRKTLLYTAIISFPLILLMASMAEPLIILLIGEKWRDSVYMLQIMAFYGILYPVSNLNLSLLSVHGSSHLMLKLEFIKKILFLPIFIIGFYFEMKYLLIAVLVYYYIEFYFNVFYTKKLYDYSIWTQLKDLMPVITMSIIVFCSTYLITFLPISYVSMLILQLFISITTIIITTKLHPIPEYRELKDIVVSQFKNLRNVG